MQVNDIITENLDEANVLQGLKRAGMAGALAANIGLGYTGYDLATNHAGASAEPVQSQNIQPQAAIAPASTKAVSDNETSRGPVTSPRPKPRPGAEDADPEIHPAFPEKLLKQKEVEPNVRVQNFIDVILPYIQSENDRIMKTRNQLISIQNRAKEKRPVSRDEITRVRALYQTYGVDNLTDLIKKVDVIPASLALAQGAIESGWGSDYLARQGNAFYGQKSWAKSGGVEGPYGERYRAFESPAESVRAYMFNLNTHSAYADFREARSQLRKSGKSPTGLELVPYLTKYSTLGKEYVNKVAGIIRGRKLSAYDRK